MTDLGLSRTDDGGIVVDARSYRLALDLSRPRGVLTDADGRSAGVLALLSAVHVLGALDSTASIGDATVAETPDAVRLSFTQTSAAWREKRLVLECRAEEIRTWTEVVGRGSLTDVHLLGGFWSGDGRRGPAFYRSAWPVHTLFSPQPDDPRRVLAPAREGATLGVVGNDQPGRAPWFFTPPPLLLAATRAEATDPRDPAAAPWLTLAVSCGVEEATFTELAYEPISAGYALRLAYEGETAVDGEWRSPVVTLRVDEENPYLAIARHTADLRAARLAPATEDRAGGPAWWRRPIFCGWGAQMHLHETTGERATSFARQERYDEWLDALERNGVVPGTITIDDKWQLAYGTNEPDPVRWPDLRAWIGERHGRGQRVLLWFKAWDPEGLPAEECIRDAAGRPVAVDPTNAAYLRRLAASVHQMLAPDGLDADGFKVDFTAQTPSGPRLRRAEPTWGVALLHRLLGEIYRAAKAAKPDALIVTHTPHPWFADVSDMLRLNDLMRLGGPDPAADTVPQMRYRAAVAHAAVPELLIDSDDWCMPSKADWRAYLAIKHEIGVPALYYATHIDRTGEPLEAEDYAAIREAWARAEEAARTVQPEETA